MVKLNRRIKIRVVGSTVNDQGGNVAVTVAEWEKWAHVEDRRGRNNNPYQQQVFTYDYKVTARAEESRPVQSNYLVVYKGKVMKIESITIKSENYIAFEEMYCTVVDEDILIEES